jgi:hypothetical protein
MSNISQIRRYYDVLLKMYVLVVSLLLYPNRRFFPPLKTFSNISIQVQGDIYSHACFELQSTLLCICTVLC